MASWQRAEGKYPPLTPEEVAEANRRYWSDESATSVQRSMGVTSIQLYAAKTPLPTGAPCPHCGEPLAWKNKTDRSNGSARCFACRHQEGGDCWCPPCTERREEAQRQRLAAEADRRQRELDEWEEHFDANYVEATIKRLSPAQQLFLEGVRGHWNSGLSWGAIAVRVGVQPRWVPTWLRRFETLGLMRIGADRRWRLHPAVGRAERVLVP